MKKYLPLIIIVVILILVLWQVSKKQEQMLVDEVPVASESVPFYPNESGKD